MGGPGARCVVDEDAAETGWETRPTAHTEVRAPVALNLEYGAVRRFSLSGPRRPCVEGDVPPRGRAFFSHSRRPEAYATGGGQPQETNCRGCTPSGDRLGNPSHSSHGGPPASWDKFENLSGACWEVRAPVALAMVPSGRWFVVGGPAEGQTRLVRPHGGGKVAWQGAVKRSPTGFRGYFGEIAGHPLLDRPKTWTQNQYPVVSKQRVAPY